MYDKLVKRLRFKAGVEDFPDSIWDEAADAIEELVATVGTAYNELANNEANKPRWIPVTERLPKDEKDVLAYYGFKHDGVLSDQRFIGTLCYFRFDPNPHWQHEGQGKLTVTHWMPLPEPPKETI